MPMKNNRKKKNSQRLKWLHRQQVWQIWTFPTSLPWETETETKCSYPTVISHDFIRAAKSLPTADNDFMPCLQVSPRHRPCYCESRNLRGELQTCESRPSGFSSRSLGNASSRSPRADNLLASPISLIPRAPQSNLLQLTGLSARRDEGKAEAAAQGLARSRYN